MQKRKISIKLNATNWQLYTHIIPDGCQVLGTVSRGCADGALAVTSAGVYVMVNAGALASLPQQKVHNLIKKEDKAH
jgi:murein endopeptidase